MVVIFLRGDPIRKITRTFIYIKMITILFFFFSEKLTPLSVQQNLRAIASTSGKNAMRSLQQLAVKISEHSFFFGGHLFEGCVTLLEKLLVLLYIMR